MLHKSRYAMRYDHKSRYVCEVQIIDMVLGNSVRFLCVCVCVCARYSSSWNFVA